MIDFSESRYAKKFDFLLDNDIKFENIIFFF